MRRKKKVYSCKSKLKVHFLHPQFVNINSSLPVIEGWNKLVFMAKIISIVNWSFFFIYWQIDVCVENVWKNEFTYMILINGNVISNEVSNKQIWKEVDRKGIDLSTLIEFNAADVFFVYWSTVTTTFSSIDWNGCNIFRKNTLP